MRNITRSPFQRGAQPRKAIMPANSYAEGGLTSIPRYAEGDEVEAEETSTGEDILEFITNFGGAAGGPTISDIVEYFSEERGGDPPLADAIRHLMGMPKGMSKCGVVPGSNPVQGTVGGPTVGFQSCFIAGTLVAMSDGTEKKIEDINVGEILLGQDGSHNEVLQPDHAGLGGRQMVGINNSGPWMTPEHPLWTRDGWKAYRMADTIRDYPDMKDIMVGDVKIGDELLGVDGKWTEIKHIEVFDNEPEQTVYNFHVSGNNTYYADGFLAHNRAPLQQKYEADARFLNEMLGITPREWRESYGTSFPSSAHQGSDAVTRAVLSKVKQRTPPAAPVEDSKPRPTLPQTFAELDTSVAVENPATYVAGPSGEPLESLEALFDLYHTNPNVTNVTNITGTEDPEDPDYAAQAAELYAGGEPTGLGLSQPGGLNLPELLKLAGITT